MDAKQKKLQMDEAEVVERERFVNGEEERVLVVSGLS